MSSINSTMKNITGTLLLALFLSATLNSCKKDDSDPSNPQADNAELRMLISENGSNPDEADLTSTDDERRRGGFIYCASNSSAQNEILIFRQKPGGELLAISSIPTGGNGTGASLGSQGALTLSSNRHWLIAVNAGSNSISAFEADNNGMLTLTSTIGSLGTKPVSVTMHHDHIYVVNATSANIAGFTIDHNGSLTHLSGSIRPLSAGNADPAQISFSPDGSQLLITEKMTNKISVYPVTNGLAGPGMFLNSTGVTPFGYEFARHHMVVSNASGGSPNASTVTSYSGVNNGILTPVSGPVPTNQTAACWVATTRHGRFAFITNTGSDNISSFYVGPQGTLHLIAGNAAPTGDSPLDIILSRNNINVYALCSAAGAIHEFRRNLWGTLTPIGSITGIPASAAGLAAR